MEAMLIIIVLAIVALSQLVDTSIASFDNVLLTGEVLPEGSQLSYHNFSFVLQNDCNVVLHNNKGIGYEAGSYGIQCKLILNHSGQMMVLVDDGSNTWVTWNYSTIGNYASVLGPDGEVLVYGPSVWSTPDFNLTAKDTNNTDPTVERVLFVEQILRNNAMLGTTGFRFVLKDCTLKLVRVSTRKVLWSSGKPRYGKHKGCIARLDNYGELSVVDEQRNATVVWSSGQNGSEKGNYVLVLQKNGQAVIYGPSIWSTANAE